MKAKLDYQDLQVSLAEWKINAFRYDAYVRSIVLGQLNQTQKELLAAIISEDIENLTKHQLDGLLKDIDEIIDTNYDRISSFLDKTNKEFYITSHQVEAIVYNEWLGVSALSVLPKYKLEAIKVTPLFEGRALGDWWGKQQSDLKFNLETIIRNGNVIGESQANIARQVRHRLGITAQYAETLVRTANASISSAAQSKLMEINADVIHAKQHLSTLDSRTTLECGARDGKQWTLDNEPIGHTMPFKETPLHPNCRSIIQIVIDTKHKSTRASEFGPVDSNLNYSDWLKQQEAKYQDGILGKRKAQWFRDGKVSLQQMLNQNDRPLTIEQLRKKYNL
ncbi:minor capsid protein [Ignatzschineria rhizosphaerae]|uniref:Minor capsid protein n=1 Tax=Ignatzschineria rhizosphaerae TaxID=2923279 RepID=A0ABY3X0W6_9GAMM|nr:minor capsid protein [Ignatzschineria rhizosphaerae]UNM95945.1 minor capsid protein [Ignatzschineria rhizosphaerae]